MVKRRFKGL